MYVAHDQVVCDVNGAVTCASRRTHEYAPTCMSADLAAAKPAAIVGSDECHFASNASAVYPRTQRYAKRHHIAGWVVGSCRAPETVRPGRWQTSNLARSRIVCSGEC